MQPEQENQIDDAEGHGRRNPRPEVDDADGHAYRPRGFVEDADDTEGHAVRGKG
jgi:hypothetical protein